jgi:hypothetical protein
MVFGVVWKTKVRAADAKEVGVENPAEETFRYPNLIRRYADRMRCQRRPGCGLCNQLCSEFIAHSEWDAAFVINPAQIPGRGI